MELNENEERHPFTKEEIEKIRERAPGMYILEAQEEGKSDYQICKIGSSASNIRWDLLELQEKLTSQVHNLSLYYRYMIFRRQDLADYATPQRLLNEYRRNNNGDDPPWQLLT